MAGYKQDGFQLLRVSRFPKADFYSRQIDHLTNSYQQCSHRHQHSNALQVKIYPANETIFLHHDHGGDRIYYVDDLEKHIHHLAYELSFFHLHYL